MPKYYRFRPTSPTRRSKRKDKESHEEILSYKYDDEYNCPDVGSTPTAYWYLRRTSWRKNPSLIVTLPRLVADIKELVKMNHRGLLFLKLPKPYSQEWMDLL